MDIVAAAIRNIVFPFMEKRKGNKIRNNLRELKGSQGFTAGQLKNLQSDKLKILLLHCIKNVEAYKSLKHLESKIQSDPFAALAEFPVLTREVYKESAERYISDVASRGDLIPNQTGGSTGVPVKFSLDRRTVEYYEAARYRGLSWNGIDIGDRSVMIWGNPLELNKQKAFVYRLRERLLKNRIIIPAFSLNPDSIEKYVRIIRRYKPKYVYGYLSSLFSFASLMLKSNINIGIKLAAAVSTSETLHEFQREIIAKAFECPVVNEYGARDGGIMAYTCASGRLHISVENHIFETLDVKTMQPVEPGNSGVVVVTDLNNFSMPRIRYNLGDMAALSDKVCSCGMGLPVIEELQGREDDIFLAKDGTLVHSEYFTYIARSMDGIGKFQMLQHTPDSVTFTIVKTDGFEEKSADIITNAVKTKLGVSDFKLVFADDIPVSGSGKYRFTKREFPLNV